MKKIALIAVLISGLFAGEISNNLEKINKNSDQMVRIEKKLDLIIEQYLKEERVIEKREEKINSAVESTKEGLQKGADWLSDKLK